MSYLTWEAWVAGIVLSFAALETLAIVKGRPTLSQTVWGANKAFPLLGPIFGLIVGGLAVHFFWIAQGCGVLAK